MKLFSSVSRHRRLVIHLILAWDFKSVFCHWLLFLLAVPGSTERGWGMSRSLNRNAIEVYKPACTHWGGIYHVLCWTSQVWLQCLLFCGFLLWFWEVPGALYTGVVHLVFGNNKLLPEREDNSTNILGTKGWVGTESYLHMQQPRGTEQHQSSTACPLQSWAHWQKDWTNESTRQTEDW